MNTISLISVAELLDGRRFFIPAYQRGYRWSEAQMFELLDDLYEFAIRDKKKKSPTSPGEFYCLQPVIVQRIMSDEKLDEIKTITGWGDEVTFENTWEVIDGQQRLTSIYILFRYLVSDEITSNKKLSKAGMEMYHLCYETRPETAAFLENLSEDSEQVYDNIDFCFISNAYDSIGRWLKERGPGIAKRYGKRQNSEDILTSLYNLLRTSRDDAGEDSGSAQFIWYELAADSPKNPIDEFVNINNGKIRLTDAELIKGLILQKRNFLGDRVAEQMKISLQWENIENTLHHNDFWHFLSASSDEDNRIELLFRLRYFETHPDEPKDGDLFRYYFNDLLAVQPGAELKKAVEKEWEKIMSIFNILQEWYEDPVLYNVIGFLIHSNVKLENIISWHRNIPHDASKQTFLDILYSEIEKKLPSREEILAEDIKCEYGLPNVKYLLLFLNIFQLNKQIQEIRKTDATFMTPAYKFPYDLYISQEWDVEHIDSATKNDLHNVNEKKVWLRQSLIGLDKLTEEMEQLLEEEKYDEVWDYVLHHSHSSMTNDDKKNRIGNLTLLDSKTNRGYKNSIFAFKRIEINQAITSGRFVPICTQMVFNKSFGKQDVNLREWSDNDKESYEKFILNELRSFYKLDKTPVQAELFNGDK